MRAVGVKFLGAKKVVIWESGKEGEIYNIKINKNSPSRIDKINIDSAKSYP